MKLPNFRDYVRMLYPYAYASLRDLKDAFRQLVLALSDQEFIQYSLFGLRFRDLRVAYGEAAAAACCQEFSTLIIWICENKLPEFRERLGQMAVHVDDFLIVARSAANCSEMTTAFDRLLGELGVHISVAKNEDCVQRAVVHGFGFKLDVPVKTVFIPSDKATELVMGCLIILSAGYATGEALESLAGKIMHWAQLKRQAKALCNRGMKRIYRLLRKEKNTYRKKYQIYYVDELWRTDFALFLRFFLEFREVPMAEILFEPSLTMVAATDASSTGGGFICANQWYGYTFATKPNKLGRVHSQMHINMQEAHAVLMMLHHCRHMLTGRKLWLLVDNTTCLHGLINAWSSSRALMDFIQEITMMAMLYRIDFRVDYITSEHNLFADMLSRQAPKADIQALLDLYGVEGVEQTNVEYYDYLRFIHEPISMPQWLKDIQLDINSALRDRELPNKLLRMFSKDFEPSSLPERPSHFDL